MTRFDYLHDAMPDFVRRAAGLRFPRRLRGLASALVTLLCVAAGAAGIESLRVREATTVERRAQARFDRSAAVLARARLEWRRLDTLVAQDRELRTIRLSGSLIAARLARTGNLFSHETWLETMAWAPSGSTLKGGAATLDALGDLVTRVVNDSRVGHPQTIRISRGGREESAALAFEMRLAQEP